MTSLALKHMQSFWPRLSKSRNTVMQYTSLIGFLTGAGSMKSITNFAKLTDCVVYMSLLLRNVISNVHTPERTLLGSHFDVVANAVCLTRVLRSDVLN